MSSDPMSSDPMSSDRMGNIRERRFSTGGVDDPDQLVGVAAGELLEWGWLIGALADWLAEAPDRPDTPDSAGAGAVTTEFTRYFAGHPTRHDATWMLNHIAERIGGLLDGDRGQP